MSTITDRLERFRSEIPHWVDLLAFEPARHILRHDTVHPAFHGCIDWHSACHAAWALLAHRNITQDKRYESIVDTILMPTKLEAEARNLADRPAFEMPYGRAWLLRLALEDRLVTGSTRLTFIAREVASSLVAALADKPVDPFLREYQNPSWALLNLFDYANVEKNRAIEDAVRNRALQMLPALEHLPEEQAEADWPDFMGVTPGLCELLLRTNVATPELLNAHLGERLRRLTPIRSPSRAHHHALNFSRGWQLFAIATASGDETLLSSALDHIETNLFQPSWWRGNYRDVSHWIPQFGIFALHRVMSQTSPR